jgi:transcriptional regulator with XRE-family HTH domain
MTVSERLGANLRKARRGAFMSQEDLSRRTGLHRTEISQIERGARIPGLDTAIKLLGATDADPGDLIAGIAWHGSARYDEKGWFTVTGTDGPVEVRLPRRGGGDR